MTFRVLSSLLIMLMCITQTPCTAEEDLFEEDNRAEWPERSELPLDGENSDEESTEPSSPTSTNLDVLGEQEATVDEIIPIGDENACTVSVTGDVRSYIQSYTESVNGIARRGHGAKDCAGRLSPARTFDIEANLIFEYKCDKSWALVQLQFDNPAGVKESTRTVKELNASGAPECQTQAVCGPFGSGRCDVLCLKKAFWGWNICKQDKTRFDVEIGRRRLYHVFDSVIQFNAIFDGILFRYATEWAGQNIYCNAGALVVDYLADHYAYVAEAGMKNICEGKFDLKYSLIHWQKKGENRAGIHDPCGWRSINSQITFAYRPSIDCLGVPVRFYGAYLYNHAAEGQPYTKNRKLNNAFYVGVSLGEVSKAGEWALDMNYQWVQAQAIADPDVNGIGRGNVLRTVISQNSTFYTPKLAAGNANYKGAKFEFLYAWTDSIQIDTLFEFSRAINPSIGGKLNYNRMKMELIFAF